MTADRLAALVERIRQYPPHERRAKCHKLLGYALEFERGAADDLADPPALALAARQLREVVCLIEGEAP